jgi:hypothetical protein
MHLAHGVLSIACTPVVVEIVKGVSTTKARGGEGSWDVLVRNLLRSSSWRRRREDRGLRC